jgi:hypothetical protein
MSPTDDEAELQEGSEGPAPLRGGRVRRTSTRAIRFVHSCIRNSPWVSIAVLVHVLLIAIFSVMAIGTHKPKADMGVAAISVSAVSDAPPEAIEEIPEIIDRNSVPVLPDQDEGPVNPDENYIPDADAGRQGEITDEIDPTKEAGIFNPDPEALSNLPSGATGGTPIGVGTVGHVGKGVSAFSSRRAGGGGKGGGGLGQGGGGGRGGVNAEKVVNSALIWLAKHQSPDGSWDSDGFQAQCKVNQCEGVGQAPHDAGLTGLALLCFLGAGHTHVEAGPFRDTVKNGLKWLMSVQDDKGCFGDRIGQHFAYDHACAALAMVEAYGMTQAKPLRQSAQNGIGFVLAAQNPYSGWRYQFPPDGTSDTSVTGWMVMVLKSGDMAGLKIDEASIQSAMSWINEMTDPATGRTGYVMMGSGPSRLTEFLQIFPPERSEAMTAVGVLTRVFAGGTAESDPMISKGADLMAAKPPVWDTTTGDIDFYYWYYATLAMFQVGGPRWDRWNEAIKTAIIDHQRNKPNEDEFGSWDPMDPWSKTGGRIYSTAVNCLSMEVYYRYPRVFGTTTKKKPAGSKRVRRDRKLSGVAHALCARGGHRSVCV